MNKKSTRRASRCNYVILSSGEIKKLVDNCHHPHKYKSNSEQDLFKCKPSGKIVIGRKPWHQDKKTGDWVSEDGDYEDIGLNINDLPWEKGNKAFMEDTVIEFRIRGLKKSLNKVLSKLPIVPDRVFRKGERRGDSILTHKEDWFAYAAVTSGLPFQQSVTSLLDQLYLCRQDIKKACGPHDAQLFCAFYFDAAYRRPAIHLTTETMVRLRGLRASLDVDLYPISSGVK